MAASVTVRMFNRLALYFVAGLFLATAIALLLPYDLGILFLPAGLVVILACYVAGGGHSIRPVRAGAPMAMSQKFARVEQDIRMYERDVNWHLIYIGFVVGAAFVVAGLMAFFV